MNPRTLAILVATFVALLPGTAHAHISDASGFIFGGMTLNKDTYKTTDPINVVYYPYGRVLGQSNTARVHAHQKAHWRPMWAPADEFSSVPACKGNQRLLFRDTPVRIPENEDHGAGWAPQAGPWDNCRTRYHIRMWSDAFANDTHSQQRDTWVVGDMHHERIRGMSVKVRCLLPPGPACIQPKFQGHYIDLPWEEVEHAAVTKMRRAGSSSAHLDPLGGGSGQGHCNKYHWKPLAGSGPAKIQKHISDGWLTRISMLHCARGTR